MGFTPGGPGAPGGLSHWVTKTDVGIRITDLWTTREDCDTFVARLGPIIAEVGAGANAGHLLRGTQLSDRRLRTAVCVDAHDHDHYF